MKWLQKDGSSEKNVPMLLLLAVGVIEFLFITMESLFSGIGYYLSETYLIVPCLLMLGYSLREKPSPFARRRLLLAGAMIVWCVIVQCIHRLSGMGNHPMATVFLVYLMAFPFAVLADDRKNAGLWQIGRIFLAAALVLAGYSLLLLLDMVPSGMESVLFWDGARLHALWHPNIDASYFMIGIGFALAFCARAEKIWAKALAVAAVVLLFFTMALTNCRTTLLMTSALLGGVLFLAVFRGGWKRFVLGLLAAVLVLTGSFKLSGAIYQWNNDRLLAAYSTSREETVSAEDSAASIHKAGTKGQGTLQGVRLLAASGADREEAAPDIAVSADPGMMSETGTLKDIRLLSASGAFQEKLISEEDITVREDTGIIQGDNIQGTLSNDMRTLNGRTAIWKSALSAIRDDKNLAWLGTEYVGIVISSYNFFPVDHAHNSWMEALMKLGIPGLVLALVFTAISVRSVLRLLFRKDAETWKKIIAMLTVCLLVASFLEPYLFITNVYYHVMDFIFFFCTGYLDFWCSLDREK